MYEKMTIEKFNDILASKAATPGGGSALAIVGGIACALVEMSVNVTLKKMGETDEICLILRENLPFFGRARNRMNSLADEDAAAFGKIVECMKLPNNSPEEKQHKHAELQKAYHKAALVPLDVMRVSAECLARAKNKVFPYLYNYVSSDCKVGMDLFRNIIENSMENVRANTCLITDRQLAAMLEKQAEEIVKNSK